MALKRSGAIKAFMTLALISAAALANGAPGVRAQVDRSTVQVGESFTLSIIMEGLAANVAPTLPPIPAVMAGGVSQRNEFVFENGQSSSKQIFEYQLIPTQPGDVNIPAVAVQAGGSIFSTQPITVKALAQGAAQPGGNQPALFRLNVPKTEAYLGEAIAVELQLLWRQGYAVSEPRVPPLKAPGFSTSPYAPDQQPSSSVLNGVAYQLWAIRTAATPARTGELTLGPGECQFNLRAQPRTVFESFNPQPGRAMALQTEPKTMRILPLPTQNVPENFNGAVGTYNLSMTAGPTNLVVGDPITIKVQISGRGQLDALSLPPQPQWREFKTYAASSAVNPTDPLGLSGSKTFEQVIVPENHEIRVLPPLEFSFFDPTAKTYRTLKGPTIPLSIRPSASATAPAMLTNTTTAPVPLPQDDIIHIRARLEPIATIHPPLLQEPWFLGLQAVPVVAWIGLFVVRKRKEKLANNPRLRRQREATARVREGLRELPELAAARRTEDFFATVFRLLQEQLGARLDVPASGITEAVIDERLRGDSLPEGTVSELRELFHACNQARYAPHRSSEELSSYIPRLENVLRDL
ncbi:MAG TPA: BatD family protein [Verrucomicrobiae bacterium]|nr:BatD family protein [Verrucomicrobiae bacterium]